MCYDNRQDAEAAQPKLTVTRLSEAILMLQRTRALLQDGVFRNLQAGIERTRRPLLRLLACKYRLGRVLDAWNLTVLLLSDVARWSTEVASCNPTRASTRVCVDMKRTLADISEVSVSACERLSAGETFKYASRDAHYTDPLSNTPTTRGQHSIATSKEQTSALEEQIAIAHDMVAKLAEALSSVLLLRSALPLGESEVSLGIKASDVDLIATYLPERYIGLDC